MKKVRLEDANGPIGNYSLVCLCEWTDETKNKIFIRSPITFENLTARNIFVKILNAKRPEQPAILELKPADFKPVPFDLIENEFLVSLDGGRTYTNQFLLKNFQQKVNTHRAIEKMLKKEKNHFGTVKFFEEDGQRHQIAFQLKRHPKCPESINITFVPSIRIKNCLPWPLKYRMSPGSDVSGYCTEEQVLFPQQGSECYNVDIKQEVFLEALIPGFNWSVKSLLIKGSKDQYCQDLVLPDGQFDT